ncbi:MAG TPA: hypothetical protein VG106_11630, partial [Vicinamibacterales bacterium]|nr:hypothetical protein [Vicinamibacterales bacterium]
MTEVPLPGGLHAALAAVDDRVQPDRSHFLLEFIRRTYASGPGTKQDARDAGLRALLLHLEVAARPTAIVAGAAPETLPLPLTPAHWIDIVFSGRATPQTLVAEIVRSRGPALLYYGLLSLDDETRAWLGGQPELLRQLATELAPGFAVAAPGLRVSRGVVRVPGGDPAIPGWETLVGQRVTEPVEFMRAIATDRQRRLAYFIAAMGQLTARQAAHALNVQAAELSRRADGVRRLHAVFERLAPGWNLEERTFWRPAVDPALLVSELPVDAEGNPVLIGPAKFWDAVFADGEDKPVREENAVALVEGTPADFVWLAEQIFGGDQRRRYPTVLFASRLVRSITAASVSDAVEALRAVGRYPALVASLERANVRDLRVYVAASRRAARFSMIEDETRAGRALAQFQGALALLTRAAIRGGVPADALPGLVTSLAAVELNGRGEYDGGIVRWLDTFLNAGVAARDLDEEGESVERALIDVLAGAAPRAPQIVEWEGTRYRVDTRNAERARLQRLLGSDGLPYLSSARALVAAADVLAAAGSDPHAQPRERTTIERVAQALDAETRAALERLLRDIERRPSKVAAPLRAIADTLAARGLLEFAYAIALGHPERAAITAADAASRHQFGLHLGVIRRYAPWRMPASGSGVGIEWHVIGSLLGLDVKLSEFSLIAVSSKPPLRKPSVPDEERRLFVEAVALVEPATLTDE